MKKIGYIVVALVMLLLGFFQSYKFACDGGSKLALPIDEVNAEENIHKGEDVSESTEIIVGDRVETVEKSNVSNSTVGYFQVLTSNLPIYDNRSGELEQVGTLTKGQVYPITGDYGNWHKIQFDNYYGYVYKENTAPATAEYLQNLGKDCKPTSDSFKAAKDLVVYDNSSGQLKAFGTIDKGQTYSIVSDYGKWWRILFAGRIGYVSKSSAFIDNFTEDDNAFMLTENASLSVIKDGKQIRVATLMAENIFERIEDYGNWHKVKYGSEVGYIWKAATKPATSEYKNNEIIGTLFTLIDSPVYASTKDTSPAAMVEGAQRVSIIKEVDANWYEIELAGRNLFIEAENVMDLNNVTFETENHPHMKTIREYLIDAPFTYDNQDTKENETIESANYLLQDKIRFNDYNGGIPIEYSNGIDWTKGPGIADEQQRSFLRQLHGLFFINDLSEAYSITEDKKYIEKGYGYIHDWMINNPYHKPKHNMAWHDEGTARRLSTLVNFFDVGKSILTDKQKLELFEIMVFHANLLADDDFYSENTNHGMFQDEGLIVFSKYFYDKKVLNDYYKLAVNRLDAYFESLISEDGVHLEHSPSYHQTIGGSLRAYGDILNAFDDIEMANKFYSKYNNMAKYATHVIKPDGTWPLIADTYAKDQPRTMMWPDDANYQYSVTKGKSGEMPTETNAVFPDAGYAVFRDQWTNPEEGAYVFFTAAYHTNYHKHSDDLSLWIYHDGEDIITEAAPYSYTLSDPVTQYAYSSFGHNTLIVDNEGLPRVDGKYESTYLQDYNIDDENHPNATGVNKRYEGVTHTRNLAYNKVQQAIQVNDTISSDENHNYKLLWHLAPGIVPVINTNTNEVTLKKDNVTLMVVNFESDDSLKLSSVYGDQDKLFKSWTFEYDYKNTETVKRDVHTIIVDIDGSESNVQTTFKFNSK
ncbi:hypothetical protein CUC15_17285 [Oceanobacillus zhaokaii]|uniref:Uncharacterized protein n=1 Tax=Oceanobacillus zhaokaii TaxID=2052660 RepID=A0A345PKQ0_9BACI|nr:alginate lyase family protein [Oceanobacillus zhaokaii]AXI10580.1 hypothetical protein CUC15_17285 [Oceanobacillus zhaokaii]